MFDSIARSLDTVLVDVVVMTKPMRGPVVLISRTVLDSSIMEGHSGRKYQRINGEWQGQT